MKNLIYILSIVTSLNSLAQDKTSCLDKYEESKKTKEERLKTKRANKSSLRDFSLRTGVIFNNYNYISSPTVDDFEKDVLSAYHDKDFKYPVKLIKDTKQYIQEKYPHVTYKKIHEIIKSGMDSGDFCGFLFKKRPKAIMRYVKKQLKDQSPDMVDATREIAVDTSEEIKDVRDSNRKELESSGSDSTGF